MKKLISIFGALTITATTTVMVVSCANLSNYNEIKQQLDNKDSMIILISAENCTHCQKIDRDVEKYNKLSKPLATYDSFDEMITEITKNGYNERILNSVNDDEIKLTGFGKKVEKITFKEYKSKKFEGLFDEDWLVKLKDLIRDQLRELFLDKYDSSSKPLTKKQINNKINTNYLNEIMTGTPTFLHFRHGRFIGTSNWTYNSLDDDNTTIGQGIESYVKDVMFGKTNGTLWGDPTLSETLYNKISGNATPPETGEDDK